MRRTSKIILVTIIATSILLGLGYAAISNITLTVSGTAAASAVQSNFDVGFASVTEVSDYTYVTASVDSNISATINVSGLTQSGQTASATYEIKNNSSDLSTDLSVSTSNSNTEYFTISSRLANTSLKAGESTTVTVTVELTKTPIGEDVSSRIEVVLTAMPVEPGKEGTSPDINDFSQMPTEPVFTTLADVTIENIGDYIDLRNDLVNTSSTTDDWRILYVDEYAVYLVLADYLPNESNYARNAGLEIMGQYGVYSNKDDKTLITALQNSSNWLPLTNGINDADAIGAPFASLFMASYLSVYDISVEELLAGKLDYSNTLYLPRSELVDGCTGEQYIDDGNFGSTGTFGINAVKQQYQHTVYDNPDTAIRPIIALPRNTEVIIEGNLWRIPVENTNGIKSGYVELTNEYANIVDTTVASITNDCIGQYIDIGNNLVRTESTKDDWRIIYSNDDYVYAILAEYLPNSTGYAENGGLLVAGDYGVYSATSENDINIRLFLADWNGLLNGLDSDGKSAAYGAITLEMLLNSYNYKKGTNLTYENSFTSGIFEKNNLYMNEFILDGMTDYIWIINSIDTSVSLAMNGSSCRISTRSFTEANTYIRPVIAISKDRMCSYIDGTWIVDQNQ